MPNDAPRQRLQPIVATACTRTADYGHSFIHCHFKSKMIRIPVNMASLGLTSEKRFDPNLCSHCACRPYVYWELD